MDSEMGLETILILGFAALQANAAISQSESEADAVIGQANYNAENKSKETRLRAARQQVSFLNSGLTLDGTPMAAINNTFDIGIADINQITSNAETQAKNVLRAGRMEALSTLGSAAMGASFGGGDMFSGSGTFGSQGTLSRTIALGSPDVQGPIDGFGGFGG